MDTSQQLNLQQSQTLAHQKSLNQETIPQPFMMSQATTPLQHPMTSTALRLNPVVAVQKPFSQSGINISNLLRQSAGIVFRL